MRSSHMTMDTIGTVHNAVAAYTPSERPARPLGDPALVA